MSLTVTVTPGKKFAANEKLTIPRLNQLGQPTFAVSGTVATSDLTDASVTAAKTIAGAHFYTSSVTFSAGDYTLTLAGSPAVADGMVIAFKANAAGVPDVTNGIRIKIGASTKKLLKNGAAAMQAGDIVANQIVEARYNSSADGGSGAWQVTSQLSTRLVYTGTVGGTANAITLTVTPPATYTFVQADLVGVPLIFVATSANTAAATLAVTIGGTALSAQPIRRNFNQALQPNDIRVGQVVTVVWSGTYFEMVGQPGNPTNDSAPTGTFRDLTLGNTAASPTTKVDVAYTDLVLRDSNDVAVRVSGSCTVDMDVTSAINGRDYGGAEANVWHYVWVVGLDSGDGSITSGAILSQSASSPTLPTGYTYKALVGAVYNNTDLQVFAQHGREVWIADTNIFTATNAASADTYQILAGADLTAFRAAIPPIARSCSGTLGNSTTGQAAQYSVSGCNADGTVDTSSAVGARHVVAGAVGTAHATFGAAGGFSVPVRGGTSAYNIQWKARTNTGLNARLNVSGYTI